MCHVTVSIGQIVFNYQCNCIRSSPPHYSLKKTDFLSSKFFLSYNQTLFFLCLLNRVTQKSEAGFCLLCVSGVHGSSAGESLTIITYLFLINPYFTQLLSLCLSVFFSPVCRSAERLLSRSRESKSR